MNKETLLANHLFCLMDKKKQENRMNIYLFIHSFNRHLFHRTSFTNCDLVKEERETVTNSTFIF